jgi:hypothetical protein
MAPQPDEPAIRAALTLLAVPSTATEAPVIELRMLDGGRTGVVSGYYDDLAKAARDAAVANRRDGSVYVLLNPPHRACLARSANQLTPHARTTTSDRDISRLRRLLVDFDAVRPAGVSATDTEHQAALTRMAAVQTALHAAGWPDPLLRADSGNGGHLIYALDLVNDAPTVELLKATLAGLAFRYSDAAVVVDETTFNPSRIGKLYGTVARKGSNTAERPHRLAQILERYPEPPPVTVAQLGAVAAWRPPVAAEVVRTEHASDGFDLATWIQTHQLSVVREGAWHGGHRWILNPCPFNAQHTNSSAYIVQLPDGAIAAGCHHQSCAANGWRELRRLFEPSPLPRAPPVPHAAPDAWPAPLGPAAFLGLAGEVVETIAPYTEADEAAILISFLTAFGCAVGAGPHAMVAATRHSARIFAALVGRTAKGRKGDAAAPIHATLTEAGAGIAPRVQDGLSSGEGVIHAVRDALIRREPVKDHGRVIDYQEVEADPGEADKRLLVVEPEFARVLRVMSRQGNTLSPILRAAWDKGDLQIMTRHSPAKATGAHVVLMGHITMEELRRELLEIETANGFANRIVWMAVKRSKLVPEPAVFAGPDLERLAAAVNSGVRRAHSISLMQRDAAARALWADVYPELTAEREGLAGAILARAEANVLRLSLIYALVDGSATVQVPHLAAALELWVYAEASVLHIFGAATGDAVADGIVAALQSAGELSRTQIRDLFGRHEAAGRIDHALQLLLRTKRVQVETRTTGGRPVEIWRLAGD